MSAPVGPVEAFLRRLIGWLDDNAEAISRLHADAVRWQRHHPAPMPPGVVTWNPRRRRTRRPR